MQKWQGFLGKWQFIHGVRNAGNGVSTDMGVSTESFLSELEVYEDDDVNSAMDETHSVPGTHSAWRICQEGPHHTHVLDIPILAWPDLSSGATLCSLLEPLGVALANFHLKAILVLKKNT